MKNKKLSLKDLKVNSFVTSIQEEQQEKLVGGAGSLGCTIVECLASHPIICA